jgi:hypothetical protein
MSHENPHDGRNPRPKAKSTLTQGRRVGHAIDYITRKDEPFTPPCRCGWPLLNSDKSCTRCGAGVPWEDECSA